MAGQLVGALDHGTTSTRFLVVAPDGSVVAAHRVPHTQHQPRPGWLEHDPLEVWETTATAITTALQRGGLTGRDLAAVGLTNQRETVVAWDRRTGRPYHRAIVWADTRTEPLVERLRSTRAADTLTRLTGLRPSSYFSAFKIRWLLDHEPAFRAGLQHGDAIVGTMDTWLAWQLTGGTDGGVVVTDVTNASRTLLMGLASTAWEPKLLELLSLPAALLEQGALPVIHPCVPSTPYGLTRPDGPLGASVPLTAVLGDQQAALVGQACFAPGTVKSTYGTGSFLLAVTGGTPVDSTHGLLTTVARRFGVEPVSYALEGSIAATGSAVAWLRDQLGVIAEVADSETVAARVPDSAGVYLVPAFSGLYAPYWRPDATGVIVGLSRYATSAHLVRATLEAIGYQTRDVFEAMRADLDGAGLGAGFGEQLRVDGGVTTNGLCMQLQADILGIPVVRPMVTETTALGAAFAAGLGAGVWASTAALEAIWQEGARWEPTWSADRRETAYTGWRRAVARSLDGLHEPTPGVDPT